MATVLKLDEIKNLVDIPQLIQDIEAGFVLYSEGRVKVPPVGFLHFDDPPGDVHIKYGYVVGDDYYAVKMASGFYNNPDLGLPASNGLVLLFSQKTGELKLIMLDECWLTDIRTAAAGAAAAKHLAPKTINHIGIVGTGVQAKLQSKLKQTGDKLLPKQHYLEEWDYAVDSVGNIPYFYHGNKRGKKPKNFKVQSPMNKPK